MREGTSVLASAPRQKIMAFQSCEAVNNSSLTHGLRRRRTDPLVYLIGHFLDVLCKPANECDVFKKTSL